MNDDEIVSQQQPTDAIYFERWEWGPLFGTLKQITQDGQVIADGPQQSWQKFQELHPRTQETLERTRRIEREEIGDINYNLEKLRLAIKGIREKEQDQGRTAGERRGT